MVFHTASGSSYEVNTALKKIRRLNAGVSQTARYQVVDGAFRDYNFLSPITVGASAIIILTENVKEATSKGSTPGTITSVVVRVTI